ncbi:MAG: hypothetical protein M1482_09140 [Chloroflexi bacterium]|nr:hypothetical protein [Chloroflexota bacterium]
MRAAFFSEAVREKAYAVAGVLEGQLAADIGADCCADSNDKSEHATVSTFAAAGEK